MTACNDSQEPTSACAPIGPASARGTDVPTQWPLCLRTAHPRQSQEHCVDLGLWSQTNLVVNTDVISGRGASQHVRQLFLTQWNHGRKHQWGCAIVLTNSLIALAECRRECGPGRGGAQARFLKRQLSLPVCQWAGAHRPDLTGMDSSRWNQDRLHRARQPLGERLLRKLQQQAPRRAARWRDVLQPGRSPGHDRGLAAPLSRRAPARLARLPTSGARIHCHMRQNHRAVDERASCWKPALAHPNRGVKQRHALTLNLEHPSGVGQWDMDASGVRKDPYA